MPKTGGKVRYKMAKNINLQNMTDETLAILSGWNDSFMNGSEYRKLAKDEIAKAQEVVDKINSARAEAVANGMELAEAVKKFPRNDADSILSVKEENLKTVNTNIRLRASKAQKLVPDTLFEAYENRREDKSAYIQAIAEFLAELGLGGTERATEKVADALIECLPTAKKAVGKKKLAGHKIQDVAKNSYKDAFIAAFLEYAINVKGCLTQAEDGTLSRTVYEEKAE